MTELSYFVTGGMKILETGMILFLLLFLAWCVKLYLEPDPEGTPATAESKAQGKSAGEAAAK